MPRTPRQTNEFGIAAETSQYVTVSGSRVALSTDTGRIASAPESRRAIIRTGHGDSTYIYHEELDETIAVLMRYRGMLPEQAAAVTAPPVEEDLFE